MSRDEKVVLPTPPLPLTAIFIRGIPFRVRIRFYYLTEATTIAAASAIDK
jgi:hypothetical protein